MAFDNVVDVGIGVHLNDTAARVGLQRLRAEAKRTAREIDHERATIKIDADISSVRKELTQANRDLEDLGKRTRANSKEWDGLSKSVRKHTRTIEDLLVKKRDLELVERHARLEAVAGERAIDKHTAAVKRHGIAMTLATAAVKKFSSEAGEVGVRLGPFATSLRNLLQLILALGPAVIALTGTLVGLISVIGTGLAGAAVVGAGGLAALTVALGGVGLAIPSLMKDFKNLNTLQDAYHKTLLKYGPASDKTKKKLEEFNHALGAVSPTTRKVFDNFDRLQTRWRTFTRELRPQFLSGMNSAFKTLNDNFKLFGSETKQSFGLVSKGFTEWMQGLRSGGARSVFKQLSDNGQAAILPLMRGFEQLGAFIGRTFASASRYLKPMMDGFQRWATSLNMVSDGRIDQVVSKLARDAKSVWDFLAQGTKVLAKFMMIASGQGKRDLDSITNKFREWNKALDRPDVRKKINDFLARASKLSKEVARFAAAGGGALFRWAEALAPLAPAVAKVATAFASILHTILKIPGASYAIIAAWAGFKIAGVLGGFTQLLTVMQGIRTAAVGAAAASGAIGAGGKKGGLGRVLGRGAAGGAAGGAAEGAAGGAAGLGTVATGAILAPVAVAGIITAIAGKSSNAPAKKFLDDLSKSGGSATEQMKKLRAEIDRLQTPEQHKGGGRARVLSNTRSEVDDLKKALNSLRKANENPLAGFINGMASGWARTRRVTQDNLDNIHDRLNKLTPQARQVAVTAMVGMANSLQKQGILPRNEAAKLRKHITDQFIGLRVAAGGSAAQMAQDVGNALSAILGQTTTAMKGLGLSDKQIASYRSRLGFNAAHPGNVVYNARATGGWIGSAGAVGPDSELALLAPGEAVLNRHQQGPVEYAMQNTFGVGLDELFASEQRPHNQMAKGGRLRRYARGRQGHATAYGPPWGGIEGGGQTASGIDLHSNPPLLILAAPPDVPFNTRYYVKPNPFGTNLPFSVQDRGGAIQGNHFDIYVWQGHGFANQWGDRHVTLTPAGRGGPLTLKGKPGPMGSGGGGGGPAPKIKRPKIKGHGLLRKIGQAAADNVRRAAQRKLDAAAAQMGGGGGGMFHGKTPAGLGTFDGFPVAKWIIPELQYARAHGWKGRITSGYRSHAENVAHGRYYHSMHEDTIYPGGAVDFGGMQDPAGMANWLAFQRATRGYHGPRLIHATGFRDDGHASGTGHSMGGRIRRYIKGRAAKKKKPKPPKRRVDVNPLTGKRETHTTKEWQSIRAEYKLYKATPALPMGRKFEGNLTKALRAGSTFADDPYGDEYQAASERLDRYTGDNLSIYDMAGRRKRTYYGRQVAKTLDKRVNISGHRARMVRHEIHVIHAALNSLRRRAASVRARLRRTSRKSKNYGKLRTEGRAIAKQADRLKDKLKDLRRAYPKLYRQFEDAKLDKFDFNKAWKEGDKSLQIDSIEDVLTAGEEKDLAGRQRMVTFATLTDTPDDDRAAATNVQNFWEAVWGRVQRDPKIPANLRQPAMALVAEQLAQAREATKSALAPTENESAIADQLRTQLKTAQDDAAVSRAFAAVAGGPGDIVGRGGPSAIGAAGQGPNIIINTLHPGDPMTLRAVGDAATGGFDLQGYSTSPRAATGY